MVGICYRITYGCISVPFRTKCPLEHPNDEIKYSFTDKSMTMGTRSPREEVHSEADTESDENGHQEDTMPT